MEGVHIMEDTKGFRLEEIDDTRGADWKKVRYLLLLVLLLALVSGIFFAGLC